MKKVEIPPVALIGGRLKIKIAFCSINLFLSNMNLHWKRLLSVTSEFFYAMQISLELCKFRFNYIFA